MEERTWKDVIVAYLKVLSKQRGKPYKISVKITGALSDHFLDAGQKPYHLGKLPR
jgi:hypothetical protein